MDEYIAHEKARLQALFNQFNQDGSWISVADEGSEPIRLGLFDSYTVTRVAPHFNAAGTVKHVNFWLYFKSAGYDQGFQYAHTIKVVSWSQDDTYELNLVGDRRRRFHIELIIPGMYPELEADWKYWQDYKAKNQERFERVDEDLLEEHIEIAEGWG